MEIQNVSAAEIGRKIRAGTWDAVEVTAAFLEACAAHPELDRIYARLTPERALAEAEAAQKRATTGQSLGPLDGVPISWKDLFDTAGVATESGSLLLQGRVPKRDAVVLERATRAGLVCLGKTHQTELAFSGLGINPKTATPPNGIVPELAPGGSSSGAAVSTKLGLAAAGIGSDTGGSVRIPSAWNDLVGLKTTHGRLPLTR
ncbi:MAG: amidase, partial [Pseudomonadota bacterium]